MRVRKRFAELQSIDEKHGRVPWHVVDASQSIEEVKEKLAGKSAFVLFYIMNSCVHYKLLVIWLLHLNFVCLYLITFTSHIY